MSLPSLCVNVRAGLGDRLGVVLVAASLLQMNRVATLHVQWIERPSNFPMRTYSPLPIAAFVSSLPGMSIGEEGCDANTTFTIKGGTEGKDAVLSLFNVTRRYAFDVNPDVVSSGLDDGNRTLFLNTYFDLAARMKRSIFSYFNATDSPDPVMHVRPKSGEELPAQPCDFAAVLDRACTALPDAQVVTQDAGSLCGGRAAQHTTDWADFVSLAASPFIFQVSETGWSAYSFVASRLAGGVLCTLTCANSVHRNMDKYLRMKDAGKIHKWDLYSVKRKKNPAGSHAQCDPFEHAARPTMARRLLSALFGSGGADWDF